MAASSYVPPVDIKAAAFDFSKTPLGHNYVFFVASLVPMVFPLTVKAPVKLLGNRPKLVKGGGIFIGQIAPMLSDGNSHPAFSFRSDFAGSERKGRGAAAGPT